MLKALTLLLSLSLVSLVSLVSFGALASPACTVDFDRLQELAGVYEGALKAEDREIPLRITLAPRAVGGGVRLVGFYERLDAPILNLDLKVDFCQQPDSTELTMIGQGKLNYSIEITATFSELMLAGNLTHKKGPSGSFVLEKK